MINLDTINLDRQDPSGMYHDIANLGNSFIEGWENMTKLPIPSYYAKCRKIIISGMGGSATGGHLARALAYQHSRLPIEVVSNYINPRYLDSETLFIANSYSGNTEETVNSLIEAFKNSARLIAISTGGKVEELARKYQIPYYRNPKNICGQPRISAIHGFGAILNIISRLGNYDLTEREILQGKNILENCFTSQWSKDIPTENNQAKKIAQGSYDKIPVVWGAEHLESVAHRFKGDFNENSKSLSYFEPIPEMNHKSLTGSEFPKPLIKNIHHIFLQSKFSHQHNQLRIKISKEFFNRRKYSTSLVEFPESISPLTDILLGITFAAITSFYLGFLYGIDPAPVEAVEEFKEKLSSAKK